jgi:tRNA nucleotidyltransferase (CCA-adding enzyme)
MLPRMDSVAVRRLAQAVRSVPLDARFGVAPRALLVGGYVRDAALGIASKDVDVEVFGVAPERLQGVLEALFPGQVGLVGRAFGIFKVHFGDGNEIDVSLPRRDRKVGPGHRGFVADADPGMAIAEAARRRDFTINAILEDPLTGERIDPHGGLADLAARRLRVVDPATFGEDPLRVWRGVQFVARFGLSVDPGTSAVMRRMVADDVLRELPPERVTEEWRKLLLKSRRPSDGFAMAKDLAILARSFPDLEALAGVPQEPEWHPEGDVWTHTLLALDQAAAIAEREGLSSSDRLVALLGALCHDLGKPSTTAHRDGRIRSLGHAEAGIVPAKRVFRALSFGSAVEDAVLAVVREHLRPGLLWREVEQGHLDEAGYANAVRRLVRSVAPASRAAFLAAAEADARGRGPRSAVEPLPSIDRMRAMIRAQGWDAVLPGPLLSGRDVVALGVAPGPDVGRLVAEIEALRDGGKIATRDEALEVLRRLVGRV